MKILLTLLLLISLTSSAQSQEFAPVGAKWYYQQSDINPHFSGYTSIESVKDTMIDTQSCSKLEQTKHLYQSISITYYYMYSADRKIFYYSEDSTRFLQLYDFNKETGDSFEMEGYYSAILQNTPLEIYIDSTDSVNINGTILKTIFTHTNDGLGNEFSGESIERIGNLFWMFPSGDAVGIQTGPLRCYEDSIIGLFKNIFNLSCDTIYLTDIPEMGVNNSLSIFPNPVNDFLSINVSERNFQKPFSISIRNLVGKLLCSKIFSAEENIVDVSHFVPGIYFIEMNSDEVKAINKFIKQ